MGDEPDQLAGTCPLSRLKERSELPASKSGPKISGIVPERAFLLRFSNSNVVLGNADPHTAGMVPYRVLLDRSKPLTAPLAKDCNNPVGKVPANKQDNTL
jgi:hypothetical protein